MILIWNEFMVEQFVYYKKKSLSYGYFVVKTAQFANKA